MIESLIRLCFYYVVSYWSRCFADLFASGVLRFHYNRPVYSVLWLAPKTKTNLVAKVSENWWIHISCRAPKETRAVSMDFLSPCVVGESSLCRQSLFAAFKTYIGTSHQGQKVRLLAGFNNYIFLYFKAPADDTVFFLSRFYCVGGFQDQTISHSLVIQTGNFGSKINFGI